MKDANPHASTEWTVRDRPLETPRRNVHEYLIGRLAVAGDIEPMAARVVDATMKELRRWNKT
jgi:hypothetical protein